MAFCSLDAAAEALPGLLPAGLEAETAAMLAKLLLALLEATTRLRGVCEQQTGRAARCAAVGARGRHQKKTP